MPRGRNVLALGATGTELRLCLASPDGNDGGSEPVSIEEWCAYLAGLAGTEARFEPTEQTIDSVQIDTTRMHELAGQTSVSWRDGMRRMAKALHPDRVL